MSLCEYCDAAGANLVPVNGGRRLWLCEKCFGEATTPADREEAVRKALQARPAAAPSPLGELLKK